MRHLWRVLLSVVVAFVTSAGIAAPSSANGCITPAAGTEADPYLIETEGNLRCLMNNSPYWTGGKVFLQTSDITLSGGSTPIGTNADKFTGTYDGGSHAITGLDIAAPNDFNVGLFGATDGATLRNINVTGTITGRSNVGGLVGASLGITTISNCHAAATITGSGAGGASNNIGGLVGYLLNSPSVTGSSSSGTVGLASGASGAGIGGLVGEASGSTITDSWSTATVTGGTSVGGLIGGHSGSQAQRVYATGNVSGSGFVGGLIGQLIAFSGTPGLIDGYARGAASVNGASPWISDYAAGSVIGGTSNAFGIGSRVYGTGAVSATGTGVGGGFIGSVITPFSPNSWSASFWDEQTTGVGTAVFDGALTGVTGQATPAMTDIATYRAAGWNIGGWAESGTTWGICSGVNDGYPYLQAFYAADPCAANAGPPPPPWPQAYARASGDMCLPGWNPSWAQWPNGNTGGFVCQRTLVFNQSTGQWDARRLALHPVA